MATTLRTIAEELQVSTTLVSCVLNDKPGVWASEATRARIIETADRLKYRPSVAGRSLVTGKSMRLAVSAADADWHYGRFERLTEIRGLIEAAARHLYHVLVLSSEASRADRKQFAGLVHSKGCDGFCLYAEQGDARLYDFFREQEVPFVVIGNPGMEGLPRVDHDNFRFMQGSVAWLAAEGRKRIALIAPSPVPGVDPDNQPFARLLEDSFRQGTQQHMGAVDPDLISRRAWDSDDDIAAWLKATRPDAIIMHGLASTLQWKFALNGAGVRCPEDVVLLAHLNIAELNYLEQATLHRGLACHVYDPQAVGEQAAELLIEWVNGRPPAMEPVYVPVHAPRWC